MPNGGQRLPSAYGVEVKSIGGAVGAAREVSGHRGRRFGSPVQGANQQRSVITEIKLNPSSVAKPGNCGVQDR